MNWWERVKVMRLTRRALAKPTPADVDPFNDILRSANLEAQREALAVLLWDFFGPKLPKLSEARIRHSRPATQREITNYRTCAAFIISSMLGEFGDDQN